MHKQQKPKRQQLTHSTVTATRKTTKKRIPTKKSIHKASTRSVTTSTPLKSLISTTKLSNTSTPLLPQPTTIAPLAQKKAIKTTKKSSSLPLIFTSRCLFSTESTQTTSPIITPPDMTQEFYKLDLRVALLNNVRDHPGADSLYLLDCHLGEDIPRQLVSNVKHYMSIPKLTNRQQIVLANLKPVGFRGEKSFAMMLGGSPQIAEGETLPPPVQDAQNGLAEPLYTPTNTQIYIPEGESIPTGQIQFKPGQRLYIAGQSPVEGEIPRVNEKAIAKLFGQLGTDIEGNLTYLDKSIVFGPVDSPVKVHLGIPNAKLF